MLPYFVDFIEKRCFDRVLEIGAGTGHLSKIIAPMVQEVVAIEPSDGMHRVASEVLSGSQVKLVQIRADEITELGQFDLILSHFCLQAASDPSLFLSLIADALVISKNSIFLCSIPHPCFYNGYKDFFSDKTYSYMTPSFKKVDFTITKDPDTPIKSIPYYHRPLSVYFDLFKNAKLVMVDYDEIFPTPEIQNLYGTMWEAPRYCVFHLRRE
jgi:SAM-dependent methyltransferase